MHQCIGDIVVLNLNPWLGSPPKGHKINLRVHDGRLLNVKGETKN